MIRDLYSNHFHFLSNHTTNHSVLLSFDVFVVFTLLFYPNLYLFISEIVILYPVPVSISKIDMTPFVTVYLKRNQAFVKTMKKEHQNYPRNRQFVYICESRV